MITPQQRTLAKAILDHATENNPDLDVHTESLIRVLGSVIEGVPVMRAMGAPGDWGYGTPIGDAVLEILRENTILDRITPEEITEWLAEKALSEGVETITATSRVVAPVHSYWNAHSEGFCAAGKPTIQGALTKLREKINDREAKIKRRRDEAARLLAEADELENQDA